MRTNMAATIGPGIGNNPIQSQFHRTATVIDDFEAPAVAVPNSGNFSTSSSGGAVTGNRLTLPATPATAADASLARQAEGYFQGINEHGVELQWDNVANGGIGYYSQGGTINATAQKYLSFRAGLHRSVAAATSFTVMLEDVLGHQVFVDIGELGALTISYGTESGGWAAPPRGSPPGTPFVQFDPVNITKTAMRTYRIDLATLRFNNREFDNSQIVSVRFIFDRQTTGRAIFDDIEFTN